MEIKNMTLADVEARLAELDSIRETSKNAEEVETLAKEVEKEGYNPITKEKVMAKRKQLFVDQHLLSELFYL